MDCNSDRRERRRSTVIVGLGSVLALRERRDLETT